MTAAKKQTEILPANTPDVLMRLAIEQGANVDALEKLMGLQERWEAAQAKKEYDAAINKFQSLCPEIERDKKVSYTPRSGSGKVEYSYAPLSSIKKQIGEHLRDCGLSYRWENEVDGDIIGVRCFITHVAGHSESNYMSGKADNSGAKNDIQQAGSTLTYLMRYTLIGALGITSADSDDDGQSSGRYNIEPLLDLTQCVRENFNSVYQIKQGIADGDHAASAEAWFELTNEEKQALFLAPTKGGILTTEERKIMQSQEYRNAHFGEGTTKGAFSDNG